jgi:hypothetical protein
MTAPSLEPVEERILKDLETTIAAISQASVVAGFYTDVKKFAAMDRTPLENLPLPCVVLVHTGTKHEWGPIGLYESVCTVDLYLVLNRSSNTTWRRDLLRFAADVRRAVMVDAHRGNVAGQANAFDTHVVRTEIDHTTEGQNVVQARVSLEIQFRDLIDDLTATA